MRIVFFGSSSYVIPVLKAVRESGDLLLVVTTEAHAGQPVFDYASKNNLPLLSVSTLKDDAIFERLKALKADIGVLASFGLIIGQRYLDMFPHGIINVHPSLLPEYRGTTPVQKAILDGKNETGVSVIQLDSKMDHGPILGQEKVMLDGTETADTLYARLFTIGSTIITNIIRILSQDLPLNPILQDEDRATYTQMLTRESGQIDIDVISSNPELAEGESRDPLGISHCIRNDKSYLERAVRAYYPWPGVWTRWQRNGKEVIVKFLPEQKVQVEGKRPMSYKDFTNGYPEGKELLEKLGLI